MNGSDPRAVESAWHFASVGLAMFLSMVIAVVFIARSYAVGPTVGDIIALRPGAELPDPMRESLEAVRLDGARKRGRCLLQTDVMAAARGSLVIEAEQDGASAAYAVHWAGGPTSRGTNNCGASADLELTPGDLAHLAQVAGGFGASPSGR